MHAGKFEDESTSKTSPIQLDQESIPVYIAITWSQMLIPVSMIVVRVDHTKMLTQLVRDAIDIAADISVACIEADAYVDRFHGAQNPKKITRLSKQKMGQLVFENTTYAELLTTVRNPIQGFSGPF